MEIDQVLSQIRKRQGEVFDHMAFKALDRKASVYALSEAISELDIATASANLAMDRSYCRPVLDDKLTHLVTGGRHPVVEQMQLERGRAFVANDCALSQGDAKSWVLTGYVHGSYEIIGLPLTDHKGQTWAERAPS